jgi:hypothetical protein
VSGKTIEGWNVLDDDAKVLWREYRYSKRGKATTLAFRGKDGMVVVSPSTDTDDRGFDALREFGDVRALIANNVFHNLGQASWRRRFPDAISYAPAASLPRLGKKAADVPFRPLAELALPDGVRCDEPPGMRSGESIVTVKTAKGNVWFMGDLMANFDRLPPAPISWLFSLTASGPGYRLFKLASLALVRDGKALRGWMLDRLAAAPPSVVVPSHGLPVDASDVAEQTKTQIERL